MPLSIFAFALLLVIALPAQAQTQKRDPATPPNLGRVMTKTTFYYNRCIGRGGTHWRCGVMLHYWTNRHANGTVVY